MAYNVGNLISQVQSRLDDTGFASATLMQFLNDTQRQITNEYRLPFMEATASFTTVIGTASIGSLPSNFQMAINLTVTSPDSNEKVIPYMEYEEIDHRYPDPTDDTTGPPAYWYIFNGTINLSPRPDAAYGLTLRYLKKPTELTANADVPAIPEEYQEILVLGAHKRALQLNDNFDQAQLINQEYLDLVEKMVNRLTRRQLYTARRMPTRRG